MTAREMIEYLQMFPEDSFISMMIVDKKKRTVQGVENLVGITDSECPAFFLEAGKAENMDEELYESGIPQVEGQMDFEDYEGIGP